MIQLTTISRKWRKFDEGLLLNFIAVSILFSSPCTCLAFLSSKPKDHSNGLACRREIMRSLLVTTLSSFAPTVLSTLTASPACAKEEISDFGSSLRDATPSRPPIPLPVNYQRTPFVVDGLLSLKDLQSENRPSFQETIVFTITDPNSRDPNLVLAGAKLPVSRVASFPFRFRLDERNIINKNAINRGNSREGGGSSSPSPIMDAGDLIVHAAVCQTENEDVWDRNLNDYSKGCKRIRLQAKGFAKLLRFEDQQTTVRAPVSLILE